jgi:hypothetical protein
MTEPVQYYIIKAEHDNGHAFYAEEIFEQKHRSRVGYTARWGFNPERAVRFRTYAAATKILNMLDTSEHRITNLRILSQEFEAEAGNVRV